VAATLENSARSGACNGIVDLIDAGNEAGQLRIYDSGDVLLAALTFSDPAFGAASNGVATADTITGDASANATGTADYYVAGSMNTGTFTPVYTDTVSAGGGGGALVLVTTSIVATQPVEITSLTFTVPAS
jgi:hypothetical protein